MSSGLKSNYIDSDGLPILVPALVCHSDILGWRQMCREAIENGGGLEFLRRTKQAVSEAFAAVKETAIDHFGGDTPLCDTKAFTDNLVIAFPARDFGWDLAETQLGTFLIDYPGLQASLAMRGFVVRGAIAFGWHYMDEDFAVGDALIEAVESEVKGDPPRVILAPSARELVRLHIMTKYGGAEYLYRTPHYQDFMEDEDGAIFVDYLRGAFAAFPGGPVFVDLLQAHKTLVEQGLQKFTDRPHILKKYEWLQNYHDAVCGRFIREHPITGEPDSFEELQSEYWVPRVRMLMIGSEPTFPRTLTAKGLGL